MSDRFQPFTRENPLGYLVREVDVVVERDGGEEGTITIALSSEAPVERWDWRLQENGGVYREILDHSAGGPDLSWVKDGIPFCLDHSLRSQIGIGTPPVLGADGILRTTLRQGAHPDAAWVFADMRAGVRKKVSIGYWPGEDFVQSKAADGAIERRYRGWMLFEGSSVAVPADYAVGVGRSADSRAASETAGQAHNQERTMEGQNAPGQQAPAPVPDTRAAELAVLASESGMPERAAAWITGNTTVAAARSEVLAALREKAEQRQPVQPNGQQVVVVGQEREVDKPYESLTEFMREVKLAASGRAPVRLAARAATGMGIGTDSDGGFMVPEQFATGVVTRAFTGGKLLSRVRRIPISGNQYHMTLIDETSRVAGSQWGGVRAYRIGEGTPPTATKPKTRRATLDVTKKIGVAVWASEEQLEDASATDSIVSDAMSQALIFQMESEIWSGIGGAECLGFTNGGAFLAVSKKSGQTAGTFVAENAHSMNARLWAGSHDTAAWFIHQFMLEQLPLMMLGNVPMYAPPTGMVGSPRFGTLLGKPVEVVEYASAVGTVGDCVLADLNQYAIGEKGAKGLARSIHVKFLEGEEVFRQIVRVDGIPLWNSKLTLADGTSQVSPFVGVETR